jgi:hypothetical protein
MIGVSDKGVRRFFKQFNMRGRGNSLPIILASVA